MRFDQHFNGIRDSDSCGDRGESYRGVSASFWQLQFVRPSGVRQQADMC